MSVVHQTRASLNVVGRDLVPADVTRALGCQPTSAYLRGEKPTLESGVRSKGAWILNASDREPGDLDAQIIEILSMTTADLAVWRQLRSKYDIYLFCGLFLRDANEMLSMEPDQLHALGVRGIKILVDIYDRS